MLHSDLFRIMFFPALILVAALLVWSRAGGRRKWFRQFAESQGMKPLKKLPQYLPREVLVNGAGETSTQKNIFYYRKGKSSIYLFDNVILWNVRKGSWERFYNTRCVIHIPGEHFGQRTFRPAHLFQVATTVANKWLGHPGDFRHEVIGQYAVQTQSSDGEFPLGENLRMFFSRTSNLSAKFHGQYVSLEWATVVKTQRNVGKRDVEQLTTVSKELAQLLAQQEDSFASIR